MTRRWQRYALAAVPVTMLTVGIPFANRVEPRVLGLPFLLAWIIAWIVLAPLFLALVERMDRA
ncbi:MAG: DUF3311 domain-containing protein [Candidatus Eremiobacteraeota bacterium]|nr:DUF3311 domain-containing protein [Candidatus Eremiobacteraeota bacterium]